MTRGPTRLGALVGANKKGFRPEAHEIATAMKVVAAGHHVEFLIPSNEPGVKTADLLVDGVEWEMKSPRGTGRHTISHQMSRAGRQCANVMIDTARTPLPDDVIIAEVLRRFASNSRLRRVWILTKTGVIMRLAR